MAFESKKDEWLTVGWINSTSKGTYTVKDKNNELLGFVSKKSMDALIAGTAKGAAISLPKNPKTE